MNLKTKRIVCLLVAIASVLTIVGSVSYAYFTAIGEVTPMDATLNTAKVSVTFRDNDLGLNAELNFDESVTKKFTIENTGTADAKVKMFFDEMTNTYIEGSLTYTLSYSETVDGTYTEVISKTNVPQSVSPVKKTLANSLVIPVGKTYYYTLEITLNYLSDVNQDPDINAYFNTKFKVEDINKQTMVEKIIELSNGTKIEFDTPATTDEGVFEMEDDYGTSYYFRGAVENNYVQFAGFYWRINGDGSVRIIYDGTQAYANGAETSDRFIKDNQRYNEYSNDAKYIGYMYGPTGTTASTSKAHAQANTVDSTIKRVVDAWYKTNIADKGYGSAVSDTIFCNDRSTPGKTVTGNSSDTGLGYGNNYTAYGAYARMRVGFSGYTGAAPTFKCSQKNDAFTVNDTSKGNGALTYPVGLITADEIVAAGSGKFGMIIGNKKYYLSHPYRTSIATGFWTISPCNITSSYSAVFYISSTGNITTDEPISQAGIVIPVINLTSEYANTLIGNGTMENPYRAI